MTALGGRLTVLDTTTLCDRNDHELRVITDGHAVYAYGTGTGASDACLPTRDGTVIEVTCGQPVSYREECDGHARVDLTTDAWSSAPEALGLLDQYGEGVNR